jgi:hypothetical protein
MEDNNMEQQFGFRDIKGYEGLYGITSCGRVWSYRRQDWMVGNYSKEGYHRVILTKNGKKRNIEVHRLVAEAYIPNPENKPTVNHKDEFEKAKNCISNLEWATYKEQQHHGTCIERAKQSRKEHGPYERCSKIFVAGMTVKGIMKKTGLPEQTIRWRIKNGWDDERILAG